MNLKPTHNVRRAAQSVSNPLASSTSASPQDGCHGSGLCRPRSLRLASLLAVALLFAALTPSAWAQASVTLAWNASTSSGIAGYRLYVGSASRTYTSVIAAGNSTTATASSLVSGATYYFAVTAVATNGLESAYSSEVSYTVPASTNPPPTIALSSPANGAAYTASATLSLSASVTANGHTISQVQFFSGTTLLGTDTASPYTFSWSSVSAGTYSLSAKLVYDSTSSVASAPVTVTVAAAQPVSGMTFAADSGTYTAPFVDNNGLLSQAVTTGVTNGGRAAYNFNITNAGNYLVSAEVLAPNDGQNSFYVNIDAEPTDPLMIWDIPIWPTLTNQIVAWRGNGTSDAATAQYNPVVFSLAAGAHQLIIRGREGNTTLGTISIIRKRPHLWLTTSSSSTGNTAATVPTSPLPIVLNINGDPGQTYSISCSQDLRTWTTMGTVILDATGSGQFTDPAGARYPLRLYRVQGN